MTGGRRRGFLGWLSDGLKGPAAADRADIAPAAVETAAASVAPQVPTETAEGNVFEDLDEAPLFVPMPRSSAKAPHTPRGTLSTPNAIRPPGAVAAFETACTRCGRCVEACIFDAITPGPDGFPTLAPAKVPCQLCRDVPCASACPDAALLPLKPADIRLGVAVLLTRLCHNVFAAESCDRCFDQCPIPGAITPADRGLPHIATDLCTGCGLCARSCPATPGALVVRPRSHTA